MRILTLRHRILWPVFLLRTRLIRVAGVLFPYSWGAMMIAWWCRLGWVQRYILHRQVDLVRRVLLKVNPKLDAAQIIYHSLVANSGRFWRLAALSHCSDKAFKHWVRIDGWENLQAAYAQGQGVIVLNSHTTLAQLSALVLARANLSLDTVGDNQMKLELMGLKDRRADAIIDPHVPYAQMFLAQLQHAKSVLAAGEMVQMAADGLRGRGGVAMNLFGHRREIRTGFAELADMTGASVVPLIVSIEPNGVISLRFYATLQHVQNETSPRRRVNAMLEQYFTLYRKLWSERPGDLNWGQLRKFLASSAWECK